MTTFVIGMHDEWRHHPIAVVESTTPPTVVDPKHDWYVELDESSHAYMAEHGIGPLDYVADLAGSGDLCHETGKHEPYMDGTPREIYANENVMRIWAEMAEED